MSGLKKNTKGHNLLWLIIFIELEIRYRTQTEKSPFYTLEDFFKVLNVNFFSRKKAKLL